MYRDAFQILCPIGTTSVVISFYELTCNSFLRKCLSQILAVAITTWFTFTAAWSNPSLAFLAGFWSSWNLIWLWHWIFARDPRSVWRVMYTNGTETKEHFPNTIGFKRWMWALDLSLNYRGVGWSFYVPRDRLQKGKPKIHIEPPSGIAKYNIGFAIQRFSKGIILLHLWRILSYNLEHVFNVAWPTNQTHSSGKLLVGFTGLALVVHAMVVAGGLELHYGIIAMIRGLAHSKAPPVWPALFGNFYDLGLFDIARFWGVFWHDLLRFGLKSSSDYLTAYWFGKTQFMLSILLSFSLSAVVHFSAIWLSTRSVPRALQAATILTMQPVGIMIQKLLKRALQQYSLQISQVWSIGFGLLLLSWTFELNSLFPVVL